MTIGNVDCSNRSNWGFWIDGLNLKCYYGCGDNWSEYPMEACFEGLGIDPGDATGIVSQPVAGSQVSSPGTGTGAGSGSPSSSSSDLSWFKEETIVKGVPNWMIAAGGGIILLMVMNN